MRGWVVLTDSDVQATTKEDRITNILDVTFEVFSEFSFEDATTSEIARRARISKRDLYAYFPNKQALLIGTIVREMQRQDVSFRETIAKSAKLRGLRRKLELIGMAVVEDVLSPTMGVVRRLVISERIRQPFLGKLFFEGDVLQRRKLIAGVLAANLEKATPAKLVEAEKAAGRYFSMIAYFPSTMTEIGMGGAWSVDEVKKHVSAETDIFIKAHPGFV